MSTPEAADAAARGHRARMSMVSFEEFYRRWWPTLVRGLITQASDTRWAEDIAQETMLAARDNWDSLLTYDRPDAWLFKVAIRHLRRLEARAREKCLLDDDITAGIEDLAMVAGDDWVAGHLDLVQAIRSLPRRQAEVTFLHGLTGYTFAEIGPILGISESAAKTHFQRARERLQQLLEAGPADPATLVRSTRNEHR